MKKYLKKTTIKFKHPEPLSRSNRDLRHSGKVTFIDVPQKAVTEKKHQYIFSRVTRLYNLAKKISPNVYFLTQPVAYDENELPGVAEKWYSLYPLSEDKPKYKSNKSVAFDIRNIQKIVVEAAIANNAKIIYLDEFIRLYLNEQDNLFFDKWHLAPEGNKIAGKFIANQLVIDNVLKN